MNQAEQIIHKQYSEFVANWKPQFGNQRHIQISQEVADLNKKQKELDRKIELTRDLKELRDEIRKKKRIVLYLLKQEI